MTSIKHAKKFGDLPASRRHIAIVQEIENEVQTDRAVAIIGAAYVDLVLREAITARLLPDDKLMNDLFENRGPLQGFGSRIQVAFALKVYGGAANRDLRAIKDIRNAFAHSADAIDFDHEDVARMCKSLVYQRKFNTRIFPSPRHPGNSMSGRLRCSRICSIRISCGGSGVCPTCPD